MRLGGGRRQGRHLAGEPLQSFGRRASSHWQTVTSSTVCCMRVRNALLVLAMAGSACFGSSDTANVVDPLEAKVKSEAATSPSTTSSTIFTFPTTAEDESTTTTLDPAFDRPDWLGTRILPLREDGFGEISPTPDELTQRTFRTIGFLPPPETLEFTATIGPVTAEIADRSTWHIECPIPLEELRYLTMSHWGFDAEIHTGEMIVNASVAEDIVDVFRQLFEAQFPIEKMRVIAIEELYEPPTGDDNPTTSFTCRPVVTNTTGWSQHAYGLAVDINPFHNPYQKGDLVIPELASYYLDRSLGEPGMIVAGDVVRQAFAKIGWGWGGTWSSLDDYQHFSRSGT